MRWTLEQLGRWIAPLKQRVAMMLSKAILDSVDDSNRLQIVKISILKDEVEDKIERLQNYGFTSHPESGAECIVAFLGGNRDNGIVLSIDDSRYRLNISKGEVAVYDKTGSKVHFKADGSINVEASGDVFIKGGNIQLGEVTAKALVNETFLTIYDSHTHIAAGTATAIPVPVSLPVNVTTKTKAE